MMIIGCCQAAPAGPPGPGCQRREASRRARCQWHGRRRGTRGTAAQFTVQVLGIMIGVPVRLGESAGPLSGWRLRAASLGAAGGPILLAVTDSARSRSGRGPPDTVTDTGLNFKFRSRFKLAGPPAAGPPVTQGMSGRAGAGRPGPVHRAS